MEIKVNKCDKCGVLFENEKEFNLHKAKERVLEEIGEKYPEVKDKTCDFANGHYWIQRDKTYYDGYKKLVIRKINEFNEVNSDYPPMSYGWFRCLDDGGSMFYGVACRILEICEHCYKEWGQQYYSNKCCKKEGISP